MCGICGYVSKSLISKEKLMEMNDTMYHRGPNDSGTWEKKLDNHTIGLAQRRLSILDLSPLGHQPMLSHDGNVVIVFNGEIYNYLLLKKELEENGYPFQSHCDTEVILAAYRKWGTHCFSKMNGMFAIAIYDIHEHKLILARDRIGKKPLYFYKHGDDFVFASELKPIMKYPNFLKEVSLPMVEDFLCNKYIAAPNTIFKDTFKLLPGTYIVYQDGESKSHTFWDIVARKKACSKEQVTNFQENKECLRALLTNSVEARLIADVPVGAFLSGGIDSTIVTAIAQKITGFPVRTFSIGFHDKTRNEAPYAAAIAKYIGTQHKELYVGEKEILEMLKQLPYYYDEPFSDSSQLPTMLVSKMASEDITVALSGDGGDELFCGYKMYDWTWIAQHVDVIGDILYHIPGMQSLTKKMPPELRALINNRDKNYKTQLYIDVMIEEADKLIGKKKSDIKYACEKDFADGNWQERRMLLDMMTYLPDEILAKTDRASMKYSLEVRCPILDYHVIEQSFKIPHIQKYSKFDKKHILKELTFDYVPKELLNRPKKGFGVPLCTWLRTVLKPQVTKYSDRAILKRQGIFVPDAVQSLIQRQGYSNKIIYSSILWSFYVFQMWYQMYIEDLWNE